MPTPGAGCLSQPAGNPEAGCVRPRCASVPEPQAPSAGVGLFCSPARRPGWSPGALPSLHFCRAGSSAMSGQWFWTAPWLGAAQRVWRCGAERGKDLGPQRHDRTPRQCVVGARCCFSVQGVSTGRRPKTTALGVPPRPAVPGPSSGTCDRQLTSGGTPWPRWLGLHCPA